MQFPMQHRHHIDDKYQYYDFPKHLNTVVIGRGKSRYELLELYCGFDIETTTIHEDGRHLAFAYHFQVTIANPRLCVVFLFRKWDNLLHFFDKMTEYYNLGEKRHIIIAIANMSFEFQFIRKRLKWSEGDFDFFAKERLQPLKATYNGIEFREVLSITGGSLAQLAKDYCTTQKLVTYDDNGNIISDLDYSIMRNSTTTLTETEEAYCINDVVILSEFMWYLFCEYIRPDRKVPMTFTGILHREFIEELKLLCIQRDDKLHFEHGISYGTWQEFIRSLQPTLVDYQFYMKYLFRGGYVHGNALFTDLDDLLAKMKDITSHYPGRMNLDYFPMSAFKEYDFRRTTYAEELAVLDKLARSKCLIIHAQFDYIRNTTTHTIESKSKLIRYTNGSFDNGRLLSADNIEVLLTEKDYQVYKWFYKWEGMTILSVKVADRGKLPPYVLNVLNRHYKVKEELKRTGKKDTVEYVIAKSRANTCYGDLVKRLRLTKTTYNNELEWHEDPSPLDYDKEMFKVILSPFWGIWVTSGARRELLYIIHKLTDAGCVAYYGDTDSCKYKPSHKAEQIFKHYNASIYRHRKNRKLRSTFFDGLAEFDNEIKDDNGKAVAVPFKMLGAKRYIYIEDGKVKATVAGMPKASINQVGETPEEVMRRFTRVGFRLTPEESGKLTTSYTDEEYSANIDGEVMTELSGVALYQIPFKISLKDDYLQHIAALQERFNKEDRVL